MLLESLCFHHPDVPTYLYVLKGVNVDDEVLKSFVRKECHQLKVIPINLSSLVRGTPVQAWITRRGHEFEAGKYWYSHITDLFRLTVPWLLGGIYLDTDFIITRPVAHMRNTLVRENEDYINNAFSAFDAQHPFLEFAMLNAINQYDPNKWSSLGPTLVTRAFKEWSGSPTNTFCPGPKCIQVLDSRAAFSVPYLKAKNLFVDRTMVEPGLEIETLYDSPEVFAVHYFNKVSVGSILAENSHLRGIYLKNCVLCLDDI